MALAFKRLRPIFRERGKINAEVTGRLAETLGGIRIVKAYTAERREALVFAQRRAPAVPQRRADDDRRLGRRPRSRRSIVGVIGVLMIVVGGRAILAGEMTLGDSFMYIFFTGLVAAPVVQIASIGTQITRGLRRARSHPRNPIRWRPKTTRIARASRIARRRGRGRVRRRELRVQRRRAGAEGRLFPRAGRLDDGAGRLERFGQEHAHQPGHGVQPAEERARSRRRPRSRRRCGCATTARSSASCCRTTSCSTGPSPRTSRSRSPDATREEIEAVGRIAHCRRVRSRVREGLRHDRRRARREGLGRPAAAHRDRARDPGRSAHPDPRRSDVEPRQRERGADPGRPAVAAAAAARRSSSLTGSRPSAAPIRFSCSSTARSSSGARTTSCWRSAAAIDSCTTSSTLRARSVHQSGRGFHAGA